MTSRVVGGVATAITYNELNKLTSYGSDTYSYDSEGNLIEQSVAGVTKRFSVNTNAELSEVLVEYDATGNIVANYVYGIGLIAKEDAQSNLSIYHFDSRGSTIALTNSTATVTDQYAYDPYGTLLNKKGTTENLFTYTGRYGVMEQSNGLFYMRARFYDSGLKRFLNKDTILGQLIRPSSLNRHGYVEGNPISYIDPKGLMRGTRRTSVNNQNSFYRDQVTNLENMIREYDPSFRFSKITNEGTPAYTRDDVKSLTEILNQHRTREFNASTCKPPQINTQKQAGHVKGTPQNINRKQAGKPTSEFFGTQSGEMLTLKAYLHGSPLPGRPYVREYDFGFSIGTMNGGMQTTVRVHQSPTTLEIHGHPSGRIIK